MRMLREGHMTTKSQKLEAVVEELAATRQALVHVSEQRAQLEVDAKRYWFLRNDENTFAVMTPRRTGHIAYYGRALDELIDAAMRPGRVLAVGSPCAGTWVEHAGNLQYWECRCGATHPSKCITETAKA